MDVTIDRRGFLRHGGGLVAGVAAAGLPSDVPAAPHKVKVSTPNAEKLGWHIGVQLYTYRTLPLYEALDRIAAFGVRHIQPCFFLTLDKKRPSLQTDENLSAEVRKELKDKLAQRGMFLSTFYADLDANTDKVKRIFEFCKEMGASTIIAHNPPTGAFDMIEKLCEEYQVNVAIHNHPWAEDVKYPWAEKGYKYWKPENVLAVCRGRSKRIGACCDPSHWARFGFDPVACLKKMEGRVVSFHLQDTAEMNNLNAKEATLGEGKANCRELLKELRRQDYKGILAIEYEKDTPTPAHEEVMVRNVAFVESVAKELSS
jgi:sugar phosphate isomerase/epimerase